MNNQQSKSFNFSQESSSNGNLFHNPQNMRRSAPPKMEQSVEFSFMWKKVLDSIKKLFVVIKYKVFKLTGQSLDKVKLPWLKIVVLLLLSYLLFNKDFRFTVNMNAPTAILPPTENENGNPNISNLGIAQSVAHHEVVKKPFADLPSDNAKQLKEKAYIRRFQKTAREEMKRFGIPASIKMAQGLLESGAGNSRLAKNNKNHFGIKCFSKKCDKGHCSNHSDDHHKDFFVNYESAWSSWRAHSKLLNSKHYKSLKKHETDYEAWAYGLKKLGYATDPRYPQKLIDKIEKYKLYLLDK